MDIRKTDLTGFEHAHAQTSILGAALKQAREKVGYSVDDLALTCGLTATEITKIELGVDADEGRLRRVSGALQLDWKNIA